MIRMFAILLAATVLAGCATTTPSTALAPAGVTWLDHEFGWNASLVTVTPQELFKLDEGLEARLSEPAWREAPIGQRLRKLLYAIFGQDGKQFAYRAGHSSTATQTWRDRQGDCLSLTVLAYSAVRKLGLTPVMQEVQTPAIYGRAGELDVVNQHVNVLLTNLRTDLLEITPRDFVLDFEPDFQAPFRGTPLTEAGIVARYYNNVAVEFMARGDHARAYAHFKAAIRAEPGYPSSYSNLAVLYRRVGHDTEAESLLRVAVAMGGKADVALFELHRLLEEQNRITEAEVVKRELDARRAADPYHWLGLGLARLAADEPRHAIAEFERARDIAPMFPEVHRYLALAYARLGDTHKARDEVELMTTAGDSMNKIALLRRKLDRLEHRTQ